MVSCVRGPGGVQSIQLTLFKAMVARGEKVALFDIKDGWVLKTFTESGLPFEFIEVIEKDKKDYSKYLFPEDLLIVFNGNLFQNVLLFSNSECRVLFWEVFYPWVERFIYKKWFPIKWLAQSQEKKVLSLMAEKNAFYFIDKMGKDAVEKRLNITINDTHYLPIPIDGFQYLARKGISNKNKIKISYVGRSVNWKINPVLKILEDIVSSGIENKVVFNVVCDDKEIFSRNIKKAYPEEKIEVVFFENFNHQKLAELLKESDLHFAMGTAALDGAKLGIPTILIDASYEKFPKYYKYRWIFEAQNLGLGIMLGFDERKCDGTHSLSEIIDMILSSWLNIGKKCQSYVKENYHVDGVVDKILSIRKTSELRINMFDDLLVSKYYRILRNMGFK